MGGSEVIVDRGGSEVIAQLVREDSVPIPNLEVRALKITTRDSAGIIVPDTVVVRTAFTNDTGFFCLDTLPQDVYTLSAPYTRDSLVLPYITFSPDPDERVDLHVITMRPPGAISGFCTIPVSGSSTPVFCYIAGTSYMATTDPVTGKFTIGALPSGSYTVTFYSDGYLSYQIQEVQVHSGVTTELPEPIILSLDPDGLVPTPHGLVVTYNPHQGRAVLVWNCVTVLDVHRYIIYTTGTTSNQQDTVSDTIGTITIFNNMNDTVPKTVSFQISALDDDNNESQRGPIQTLDAVPPSWFDISMSFQRSEQTISPDTVAVILSFSSRSKIVTSVTWWLDDPDSIVREHQFQNVQNGVDTLYWRHSLDKHIIFATLSDSAGGSHTDSINALSLQPINVWKNIDSLQYARRDAGACVIDGKIYVFGGASKRQSVTGDWSLRSLQSAEMYDPSSGKWTTISPMNVARQKAAYAVLDGKIYVIGGSSGNSTTKTIEYYDPKTDVWTKTRDTMEYELIGAAACTLNGEIIITGGISGTSDSIIIRNTVISYNPVTGVWKQIDTMKTARHMHRAMVIGNSVLLIGGLGINKEDSFGTSPVFETECLFGNGNAICASGLPLPNGIYGFGAAVVNNRLVIIGGLRGLSDKEEPLDKVDVYSLNDASYTSGKSMSEGCEGMAVVEYNGGLYLIGGNTGEPSSQNLSRAVYVYYP